jgi:hypothetical protein
VQHGQAAVRTVRIRGILNANVFVLSAFAKRKENRSDKNSPKASERKNKRGKKKKKRRKTQNQDASTRVIPTLARRYRICSARPRLKGFSTFFFFFFFFFFSDFSFLTQENRTTSSLSTRRKRRKETTKQPTKPNPSTWTKKLNLKSEFLNLLNVISGFCGYQLPVVRIHSESSTLQSDASVFLGLHLVCGFCSLVLASLHVALCCA